MADLTDKQLAFIEHYLSCLNATEAASRAGYSGDRNVLGVTGHDNLRNPKIRAIIDERLADSTMGRNEVLARLTEHARGSMDDFLSLSGRGVRLDIPKALKAGKGNLIKKYSKTDKGVSIELYSAKDALELLGKYHRLFSDMNLNIDLNNLSVEQLERIAAGEDPAKVVAS